MIGVVGLGYIGLPTALMLAASGNEVAGTDKNGEILKSLNNRQLTFQEKGMTELFGRAADNGILFTSEMPVADVYIISVPTPYDKGSKKVDMSYVAAAFEDVLEVCPKDSIIVIESTVSPGSIDKVIRPLADKSEKR